MAHPPLHLEFVKSTPTVDDLPSSPAEVAVVGRSNVGKSSLINALANRKQLARVSNTPGRTQLINLFELPNGTTFVDLPGYGYAKVPGRLRSGWQKMIERYLLEREALVMIFLLVDGEVGPTKLDVQMLEWLRFNELVHTVVATKHDKVKAARMGARKADLAKACMLEPGDITWVSAAKSTGIDTLRGRVRSLLGL